MNLTLAGAAVLAIAAAFCFYFLFRHLIARNRSTNTDLEWCRDFSIARYRPMERLFAEEDYDFLAAQPGFHPGIYRKLQTERRRVFRHYLRCLNRDFDRLMGATKLLLVHAQQDRSDLAAAMLKQRLIFTYALTAVHVRLTLQGMGIGTVDVRRLVGALESMRDQLRLVAQRVQPAAIAS